MYKLFLAFRYLRAHKIIYFSIVGVAIGIMTMVVVTSLMGGFSRDMRARIRGMQAHIIVQSVAKDLWMKDYDVLRQDILKVPHVTGAAPRIEYEAWMGQQGNFDDVHLVGIVPEQEDGVSDIRKYFRAGGRNTFDFRFESGEVPKNPGIVVGTELRWRVRQAGLMTARHGDGPMFLQKDFEVVGAFKSGMAEYDSKFLFMDLKSAQQFLRIDEPPLVNFVAVGVDDYEANGLKVREAIVNAIHARYGCRTPEEHGAGYYFSGGFRCGKFRTLTWEQSRRVLLQAVDVEKGIQYLLLFLIVLVAGFNIIAIYTLVVRSKARDIGILRALGATEAGVSSVFLASGGLCGLFGSFFGIGLGLLLSWYLNEIADFIRVFSRDLNRLSVDPDSFLNVVPRGAAWAAALLLLASAVGLVWNWVVLYKERTRTPLGRMIAAGALIGVSAWVCTAWLPRFHPIHRHDPDFGPGGRWPVILAFTLIWAGFCALWRFLDRWRRRPAWVFFGAFATTFMSAFMVALAGAFAIATAILLARPEEGWAGLELFPSNIYYLDRIPVLVDYGALGWIVGVTLLVSIVFSIYPALRAAKADPIESIRDEG
jgi:lipoprotein-releasing system permease protein